jgi:hypothetical protein
MVLQVLGFGLGLFYKMTLASLGFLLHSFPGFTIQGLCTHKRDSHCTSLLFLRHILYSKVAICRKKPRLQAFSLTPSSTLTHTHGICTRIFLLLLLFPLLPFSVPSSSLGIRKEKTILSCISSLFVLHPGTRNAFYVLLFHFSRCIAVVIAIPSSNKQ